MLSILSRFSARGSGFGWGGGIGVRVEGGSLGEVWEAGGWWYFPRENCEILITICGCINTLDVLSARVVAR